MTELKREVNGIKQGQPTLENFYKHNNYAKETDLLGNKIFNREDNHSRHLTRKMKNRIDEVHSTAPQASFSKKIVQQVLADNQIDCSDKQ